MEEVKPLFSIITVVYNGAAFLEDTIRSIADQTFKNFEYIIVDGASTDGTVAVIKRNERHVSRWISEKDKGIYDAMNKGVALAKGEWINFMNCGDRFYSSDILDFVAGYTDKPGILFGDAMIRYPEFERKFPVYPIDQIWKHTPFCHQASFVRRDLIAGQPFDLAYRIGADYNFFFTAYKRGVQFHYLPKVICLFDGRSGTTNDYIIKAYREKADIALKHEFTLARSAYYKVLLAYVHLNAFVKKLIGKKLTKKVVRIFRKSV